MPIPLFHPAGLSSLTFLEAQSSHLLPRDLILSLWFLVFLPTPSLGETLSNVCFVLTPLKH